MAIENPTRSQVMQSSDVVSVSNAKRPASRAAVIHEAAPETVVAPALVVGGTDTRHYGKVSENGFRFLPIRFSADDFERMHGRDERLAIENLHFAVDFYEHLLRTVRIAFEFV